MFTLNQWSENLQIIPISTLLIVNGFSQVSAEYEMGYNMNGCPGSRAEGWVFFFVSVEDSVVYQKCGFGLNVQSG